MSKYLIPVALLSLSLLSCNGLDEQTKQTINKGGEAVGKTASEFFEGVSEGVDRTLECTLSLSQALTDSGLKTGIYSVENNPEGGKHNVLTLYLIFDKDLKTTVMAKAFSKSGLEVDGRKRK